MRFSLIDRIVELEAGQRLTAVKSPTLSEEYLQDHFPLFPVMPGVLMLESMYQAAAWLLRHNDNFDYSMVLLKEAHTVKYGGFVRPGQTLRVSAEMHKQVERGATLKTTGMINDEIVVSARLMLESFNLADNDPSAKVTDQLIRDALRRDFEILYPALASVEAG